MPPISETGHAKNVANFQDVIALVTEYGPAYNPSKATIKLPALNTKLTAEQNLLTAVIAKNTLYNTAVNERFIEYEPLRSLATRIMASLKSSDASPQKIKDAQTFNTKIQGKRASTPPPAPTPSPTPTPPSPIPSPAPSPTTVSASQQSFDQLHQHMAGLVAVVASEITYNPNEDELKIPALNAKTAALLAKNNAVATAYAGVLNARIARDKGLYHEKTGLVVTAQAVKDYVKSSFGATSPEYKAVRKIAFKLPK